MKRRAISFMTALVLFLGLCPAQVLAAGGTAMSIFNVNVDTTVDEPYEIYWAEKFDTHGNSYVSTVSTALRVMDGGIVYLTYGTIESEAGAGIEVLNGGFLCVEDTGMNVIGTTYSLDIRSGAEVRISGGTFTGGIAAIGADDYLSLLADGCAFFDDEDGDPIRLTDMAGKKKVVVKECTDHEYDYMPTPNRPTHEETCVYCGKSIIRKCEFNFDGTGDQATCTVCGQHTIAVVVNEATLGGIIYDGNEKKANVEVEVYLDDDEKLDEGEGNDYTVSYTTSVDAGENIITVTVEGESYIGKFVKSYNIDRATPRISWANLDPKSVPYSGSTLERTELPDVIISGANADDEADLEQNYLYFSYSADGRNSYISGLPTNAGKYQIKANLSASRNYQAAESEPIDLEITKINPIIDRPEAVTVTYDRYAHELVTPGSVWPGAVIQFALEKEDNSLSWSTEIPKATNAGNYNVYYKAEETDNYQAVPESEEPISVQIEQRWIEPGVKLDQTSFVYDNGTKEPPVTVTDPSDGNWVLPDTEYEVKYANNRNVGTATATVSPAENSNYNFTPVVRQFTITTANQSGLTITGLPNQVFYGDVFTLGTSGGSGNGTVTWTITAAKDAAGQDIEDGEDFKLVAEINEDSGQVKVNGLGSFTVQAKKSGKEYDADGNETTNREDATTTVTFHVDPRPVTATVTAASKPYDGTNAATVSAKVEQGVVSGDTITITGVTGEFSDANAGTGKTVTVSIESIHIDVPVETIGDDPDEKTYEKYVVTVPTTPVSADITPKTLAKDDLTVTLDCDSYTYDGSEKKPVVTVKDGSNVIPSTEYTVTYSNNVAVGDKDSKNPPTVTVTDNPGGNYTISTVEISFSITAGGKAVLTGSPLARDLTYIKGTEQELVTVGTATGGTLMYALEKVDQDGSKSEPGKDDYGTGIPKEENAGTYTVYYKVAGDGNYGDSDVYSVSVTIKPKTVTSPVIELAASKTFTYDGTPKTFVFNEPDETDEITVKDGSDVIPAMEYTVTYSNNVNAGTATVHIVDKNGGNYNVNGSTTFEIGKATAKFDPEPEKIDELKYNGKAQPLITAGLPKGGTAYYWLEGGTYSTSVPTGTDCATYKVYAMVQGDANHNSSEPMTTPIEVTIDKNTVTKPLIDLSSKKFTYNGSEQKPTVTMWDDDRNLIPANEYSVEYDGDTINVGTYQIKITSKEINYHFNFEEEPKIEFTIDPADQASLSITGKPSKVYFGDTIQLSTTGGSGNGAVTWIVVVDKTDKDETTGKPIAETGESEGQFVINGVGDITVMATRDTGDNYAAAEDSWTFHAYPKPVNAVVTAKSRDYDRTTDAELECVTVPEAEEITITIKDEYKKNIGHFADKDVGANKLVTFTIADYMLEVTNGENYEIKYPTTAVASITPAAVTVNETNTPKENGSDGNNLVYNGQEQPLLTLPAAALDGGDWAYSTDGASYGPNIPKGENAGTYEVWYKVIPDSNHKFDDDLDPVTVTIEKKAVNVTVTCSPETFPYDGTEKTPNVIVTYSEDGSEKEVPTDEYTVEFPEKRIAANDENYTVTVTAKANGNYEFTNNSAEGIFKILPAGQAPLTIVTEKPGFVYYDDTFRLSAVGGSGDGGIIWEIVDEKDKDEGTVSEKAIAEITSDGVVTVNGVGSFTVTAYREGTGGSYKDSDEVSMTFTVRPKQVNAVVEPVEMDYDKDRSLEIDDLSASVPSTDIEISGIKGTLSDVNAGDKIVRIDRDSIKDENIIVTHTNDDPKNYSISYPETITATINPVDVKVKETDGTIKAIADADHPQVNSLEYTGSSQALITLGKDLDGGFWAYSTNGIDYNRLIPATVPTGKNVDTYRIWYKVIPDGNHKTDIAPADPLLVTISKKTIDVTVSCSPATFTYDGSTKTPTVTVKDADGNVIPADEYTVEYPEDSYTIGTHTVIVKSKGNYEFTGRTQAAFEITSAAQSRLTIVYNQDRTVYYGDDFWLSASGGYGTGGIEWAIEDGADATEAIAVITPDSEMSERAKVSVKGIGSFTVTAYRKADSSYSQSEPATMTFTALPKPITAIVTAENKTYDNSKDATVYVTWESGALVRNDTINISSVSGTFESEDVGTWTVTITHNITDERYDITFPDTTATISKAKADVENPPQANTATIYVESDTKLVTAGTTVGRIGTIVYALENPNEEQEKQDDMLDEDLDDYEDLDPDPPGLVYTADVPTAKTITKPGTYNVWYKIMPTTNWIGTEAKYVEVTITRAGADAGEFEEEDDVEDLDSINPGSTPSQAPSTSQTSSPGTDTSSGTNTTQSATKPDTGSVSMQTSVQDRTASTVLDTAAGSQLVNEAVANKSANVVIKPEITGDVSKTEVSIPASAVSRIGSETDAALTVSTPVADVTIPNTSLDTLSSAGGTVSVVTERVENTVVLTLNAGGKDIGDIPGGLTLTVPSENTTPGTVAVLVHEDGTREIIRKSVAEDGSVRIPLNGSATVEIVDNSKEFADVPAESWAADAVAFASAHEILNGTGEATFSPEISMSRAMLATVLYNLEGCPDQGLTSAFSDVDSDAWYAAGISWAAANGITSGYGDGQYGPNDDITREQLAVMLWRYMESPAADKQVPDFTDTDQASSYAMEALYWATANGIVNGYGNGHLDPSGLATRAQAAQMLKNFIENT